MTNKLLVFNNAFVTYSRINLIVSSDVLMERPKQNHGNHSRKKQHNYEGI